MSSGGGPEYVFPAIRGIQAKREYYVAMFPLRLIPKLFLFNEDELVPELRAQRTLNKARVPEIARYMLANRDSYIFSALTASVDGDVNFDATGPQNDGHRIGLLRIPMSASFVINDGQHRRAAIEMALRESPDIGDETIAVVFFVDQGLHRSQQMFADLNRHAIRPARSLGLLYDHRDDAAALVREVAFRAGVFKGMVEMERSTLSARSRKLFTLSSIYSATAALLSNVRAELPTDQKVLLAADFWDEVGRNFPEWQHVREGKLTAPDVRRDFIHSHGITLQAIGRVGNVLLRDGSEWKSKLKPLRKIDWSRNNDELWEGRALLGGRVSKAALHVTLTTNLIKGRLKIALTPEEQRVEDLFSRGEQ